MDNIEKIKAEIEKLSLEFEEICKVIDPLVKKRHKIYEKIERKKSELDAAEMNNLDSLESKIEFFINGHGHHMSSAKYIEAEKFFREELKLSISGYNTKTNQAGVQVLLTKGDKTSLNTTHESVQKVLPYIIAQDDVKMINVFEYTLSEFGSYHININEKTSEYVLIKTAYHREHIEKTFTNLYDCLKYVQEYHYYDIDDEDE